MGQVETYFCLLMLRTQTLCMELQIQYSPLVFTDNTSSAMYNRILRVSYSTFMAEHGSEETALFPTQKTVLYLYKTLMEVFVTATSRLTLQNPAPCSALRQRTKLQVYAVIG